MARRQGGTLGTFTPLSTPDAPTDLSVNAADFGSASVSFTAPVDTGDAAVTSYIVTAIDESTGESTGAVGSSSPITVSPGGGTFKIRAQAVNSFGPGQLTEFVTGQSIFSGGELYAWGRNFYGHLGDGTTTNRSSPVQIGALGNWAQVSAPSSSDGSGAVWSFAAAIKTDGTLWTWGVDNCFRLGDGLPAASQSSPVQIGALTNWSQVSVGPAHGAAVKTDGTIWSWGRGQFGRLGHNNENNCVCPVQIGLLTEWAQVASGNANSSAIKTDGTLWSWGCNSNKQLGLGNTTSVSSPVQVGVLTNWCQVSLGALHITAINTDGELYAGGRANSGQIGTNAAPTDLFFQQVGALTTWSQVYAGGGHTNAIKTDGTLWTWGANGSGQLGHNDRVNRSSPVQVGALTTWSKISGGYFHTAAVKTDGTLWTWGTELSGVMGQNDVVARSSPIQVGALTSWASVAAGACNTFALLGVV